MKCSLNRLRELFFWLTLFVLPLQTRWFHEGISLGGFPWEQGRISVYASWIFIFMGVALCLYQQYTLPKSRRPCEGEDPSPSLSRSSQTVHPSEKLIGPHFRKEDRMRRIGLFVSLFIFGCVLFHTSSVLATVQFCIEAIVIGLFIWSALDLRLTPNKISIGFALSLLPSILFGFWQYCVQSISSLKYLGISAQNPLMKGVSVIEVGSERILRIYGFFPHPNIFAAWLVIAILLLALTLPRSVKAWQRSIAIGLINLFLIVLVLTFSRAALVALFIGGILMLVLTPVRRTFLVLSKKQIAISLSVTFLVVSGVFWQTRHLWFVRVQTSTRLEQRSVDERTQALRDGIEIFKQSPFLGVGPGAELVAIQKLHPFAQMPPVPPHIVWLVLLNEIGLLGILAFLLLGRPILLVVLANVRTHSYHGSLVALLSFVFLVLSFFDHYLWTLWSGKCLFVILGSLIIISDYRPIGFSLTENNEMLT